MDSVQYNETCRALEAALDLASDAYDKAQHAASDSKTALAAADMAESDALANYYRAKDAATAAHAVDVEARWSVDDSRAVYDAAKVARKEHWEWAEYLDGAEDNG